MARLTCVFTFIIPERKSNDSAHIGAFLTLKLSTMRLVHWDLKQVNLGTPCGLFDSFELVTLLARCYKMRFSGFAQPEWIKMYEE